MTVFDDVVAAVAGAFGVGVPEAGWILGFVVVIAFTIALAWVIGPSLKGTGIFVPVAVALGFVVVIGWWPNWSIVFVALILAFVLFGPLTHRGGGGEL